MDVTLRQLTYFIALAETRHFGRAAERVHVTQPALSVQMRELEKRLDTALLDRSARRVALTPAGQEVLATAQRMQAEMARLKDALRWRSGLSGRLRLGVIPTVAPYLLPLALPMLRLRGEALDLRVREAMTAELLDDLADGRLDVAVLALPAGGGLGLLELPLFQDRFLLAGAPAQIETLRTRHEALSPGGLDPNRLLLLDDGHCLATQALEVCGLERSATRMDLGASSLATLCRLVTEGFGLTFLPEIALAAESAAAPGMATLRFPAPEPAREIGLVRRDLSGNDTWFHELADILRTASARLLAQAEMACVARPQSVKQSQWRP